MTPAQKKRVDELLWRALNLVVDAIQIEAPAFAAIVRRSMQAGRRGDLAAVHAAKDEANAWLQRHDGALPGSVLMFCNVFAEQDEAAKGATP